MTDDPPSQTLSVGRLVHGGRRRSIVVMREGSAREVQLPAQGSVVLGRGSDADITVDDPTLSRHHLRIESARTVRVVDLDSHNGTRIRGRPLTPHLPVELAPSDLIEAGTTSIVFRDEGAGHRGELPAGAWAQARLLAQRVHAGGLDVVVVGPAGSGKRTLAAEILGDPHAVLDGRGLDARSIAELDRDEPLLLVHADEIDREVQVLCAEKLSTRRRRVAATASRELSLLVAEMQCYIGLHRALSGIVIRVPSLQRCGDELPAIADHLIRDLTNRMALGGAPRLAPEALRVLRARTWTGELAELVACLEATMIALRGPVIRAADLRFPEEAAAVGDPEQLERQRILDALAECGGNQTQAARLLKISRRTLVSRLDRYAIVRPRKRDGS